MVQYCSGDATTAAGTVGEGNSKERIAGEETVNGEIVGEEVGYEKNNFLDGSSSIEDTRKFVDLVVVSKVTNN